MSELIKWLKSLGITIIGLATAYLLGFLFLNYPWVIIVLGIAGIVAMIKRLLFDSR